jgi:putative drug exporter of the RND superfamily
MSADRGGRGGGRTDGSDRLALWLRRLRWPVLLGWVLLVVLLSPVSSGLTNALNNGVQAFLPSGAASTRVTEIQQAAAGGATVDQATVVLVRPGGPSGAPLSAAGLSAAAAARAAVARLHVAGLSAPSALVPSPDGKAAEFTATVTSQPSVSASRDTTAVKAVRQAVAGPAAAGGLQAEVTGSAAESADSGGTSNQTTILLRAVLLLAIILLVVYRSPVLFLLPLVGSLGAVEVAKAGAHGLAGAGLTVSTLSASILEVLVLGAASDYALLLIHRYRDELRRHARTEDAMAAALRKVMPTLLASAGTITAGMLCLLAAQSASLHGLGPVGAVGIVCSLAAQITLLPALLLVCGRWVFWPQIPRQGQGGREESRFWSWTGRRAARRPAWTTAVSVALLAAACAGLAALYTNSDPVAGVKSSTGSAAGYQLLTEHYPVGDLAPVIILAPPAQARAAGMAAAATTGVASVAAGAPAGGYDSLTVTLSVQPYGTAGATVVQALRQDLARAAPGALVGGDPAVQYDISQAAHRDTLVLIPLVLLVIFTIIAFLLRALVAPLILVLTTALSFGASFGLASLAWRYPLGFKGIEAQLPLYIFIFLVALGVDYNIFLSARIREESRQLGIRDGTQRGLAVTGGVITAAGLVMAGTFTILSVLPSVEVAEVGIAVVIGVLVDTLLVRTILVPAGLILIGERVWWPSRNPDPPAITRTTPAAAKTTESS